MKLMELGMFYPKYLTRHRFKIEPRQLNGRINYKLQNRNG